MYQAQCSATSCIPALDPTLALHTDGPSWLERDSYHGRHALAHAGDATYAVHAVWPGTTTGTFHVEFRHWHSNGCLGQSAALNCASTLVELSTMEHPIFLAYSIKQLQALFHSLGSCRVWLMSDDGHPHGSYVPNGPNVTLGVPCSYGCLHANGTPGGRQPAR